MNRIAWNWPQILVVWAVLAFVLSLPTLKSGVPPGVTGDDAMRLVEAIDLFNGQSWFDTTQYRANAPFGAPMHWSRLIDAPLVALMALARPFAHDTAPYWAAFAWPLLVLLVVVALMSKLAEIVAGPTARLPALVLLTMTLAVYTEFIPGRVDHHNVQIALTLGMIIASLLGRSSVGWALGAGALAATGVAIGTEILPSVAAVLICFALYWVVEPQRNKAHLLTFAASFSLGLCLHLMASRSPWGWLEPACDALSITYVVAGAGFGAAALMATLMTPFLRHPAARVVALTALAAALVLALVWLFPECRYGPYGNLDSDVAKILMPDIGEAQPLWAWADSLRPQTALLITPFFGMATLFLVPLLVPAEQRWRWIVLGGFCLALFVVFCLQIRGFRLLSIALLPGPAWLVAQAQAWFRQRRTLRSAVSVVLAVVAFMGPAHWAFFSLAYAASGPAQPNSVTDHWNACLERSAFAPLAALPRGHLMSFLLIGPQLLLETPHTVVSAGYHRNEAGLRDMVRFFRDGEAEARAVVEERDIDYLVFCRGIPPSQALAGLPDFDGLSWPWLVQLSPPEAPIQIYAVKRDQSTPKLPS